MQDTVNAALTQIREKTTTQIYLRKVFRQKESAIMVLLSRERRWDYAALSGRGEGTGNCAYVRVKKFCYSRNNGILQSDEGSVLLTASVLTLPIFLFLK